MTFYSLIETARVNGLEPSKYLKYIFTRLPYASTEEEYKKEVLGKREKKERGPVFTSLESEVKTFIEKIGAEKLKNLFKETITSDKPDGQKWIIFSIEKSVNYFFKL